ncbi:MAG: NAD(P)H-dependent oxidoreductase [Syntrophaceae bacterium]
MKITVLNGSPKGDVSVTLQYVHYLEKKFPGNDFVIHNAAQRIRNLEKSEKDFREVMADVESADLVLWAFPLYYCVVCSQYKRFIELVFERGAGECFKNKYAASLSTSVHFFDHTAHSYVQAICDDLDMKYAGFYSAAMYDLLRREERQRLVAFMENLEGVVRRRAPTMKYYQPLMPSGFRYAPGSPPQPGGLLDLGNAKILIVTDERPERPEDENLRAMVRAFAGCFSRGVEIVNLNEIDIGGGCLGCIKCGYDNECSWRGKDGFHDFFESKVKAADALIVAGVIRDRYLSSRWKMFFDRSFYNTHKPVFRDRQFGYIISGPYSRIPFLRDIFAASAEYTDANIAGVVTDEAGDSQAIDGLLQELARRVCDLASQKYIMPKTFLGVGSLKLFRDEIWGPLRFAFRADHIYYRQHGMYDFPQKDYKARLRNVLMGALMKIPRIRKDMQKRWTQEMIKPLQHVVENK